VAVEWKLIRALPCRVKLLKTAVPVVEFYEEPDYERLVAAASTHDPRTLIAVLLGGDAGLRLGEILALEWADIDLGRSQFKVQRAVYEEGEDGPVVTLPKGGRPRVVPMTARLKGALSAHRHLRGDRVLYQNDGDPASKWWLKGLIDAAERRAELRRGGRVHILRHTFCSRLASKNVPLLTIKELAGHESLETTQRYMHLSSSAPREAIRALEQPRGDVGETGAGGEANSSVAA
jgi:integrase